MKRQRGEFPVGKQNLNQVVVSSGFSEVGCSISRALKTRSWSFLLRDFRKKKSHLGVPKKNLTLKARLSAKHMLIGQLQDDVILPQLQIKAIVL